MGFLHADRVLETTTTTGTSTITLAGAVTGYRAFSAVATADGDMFSYVIAGGTEWEIGIGTRASATTFSRTSVTASSNAGALVNFSAGTKEVWMDISSALLTSLRAANLVINSGQEISQTWDTIAATGITAQQVYITDQWIVGATGSAVFTAQQVADTPSGFKYSLKVSVTTADTSLAATDEYIIYQPIEGYRTARLLWGGGAALPISVGFWFKGHRTGAYSGSIKNASINRAYPFSFNIISADTWEYKTVTIPGDTTGAWGATSGVGLYLVICMAAGNNFLGTANTWAAANLSGVTGTTNGVAATSDTFNITGASVIPGSVPISQEISQYFLRPRDQELEDCQRYLCKFFLVSVCSVGAMTAYTTSNAWGAVLSFLKPMRANPTMSVSAASDFLVYYGATPNSVAVTAITFVADQTRAWVSASTMASAVLTVGDAVVLSTANSNGRIFADARL